MSAPMEMQPMQRTDTTQSRKGPTLDEHRLSVEEVSQRYGTGLNLGAIPHSQGLTTAQAEERLLRDGPNELTPPAKIPWYRRFVKFLLSFFNIMLIVSGILSFILLAFEYTTINLVLGLVLVVVAFANASLEYFQESKSQSILESFKSLIPSNTMVVRDGTLKEIPAAQLVKGDLISLKVGEKIPADVRIIFCNEMKVDNSSLTGESEPQDRSANPANGAALESHNLGFYGSLVVNGDAYGIVIRCGDDTVLGQIADLTCNEQKRASQLTLEIEHFVVIMGTIAMASAVIFFIYGMVVGSNNGVKLTDNISTNFQFAIGVMVAFVPQGLPATVTMLLTIAAKRLSLMNVLVKDLTGVETLGSITLLATDKTGTLTQNKMSVVGAWIDLEVANVHSDEEHKIESAEGMMGIAKQCCLCSKSKFNDEDMNKPIEERRVFGDATETGMLRFAAKYLDAHQLSIAHPKVFEIPFSSATKWHLTLHKMPKENSLYHVYLKGAPERVLKMCKFIKIRGEILPWTEEHTQAFNKAYEFFAGQGQRVLAMAEILLPEKDFPENFQFVRDPLNIPIDSFTFVGMVSLMDPPKKGVRKAVASCRTAGIQVVMVTGDHPLTAEAIARKIGLIQGETALEVAQRTKTPVQLIKEEDYSAVVIHGDRIDSLTDEDWDKILAKQEIVFARTAPHHKLMIVTRCQNKGHIVGVSGDGVNDAPALKKASSLADLGISMNLTGSDVSKQAAAMILLDDNFPTIVNGIAQGRLIFSNLKKSIRYTLTHILPEAVAFFAFVISNMPLPLNSVLILFVDLGTELIPALSYAWEKGDSDLMLIPPRKVLCTEKMNNAAFDDETHGRGKNAPKNIIERAKLWVMSKFKKNETGEVLVDNDLLIWSYLEGGIIESAGCLCGFYLSLYLDNVDVTNLWNASANAWGAPGARDVNLRDGSKLNPAGQGTVLLKAQAAYFASIVICQWFAMFVCKKQWDYPLGINPFSNMISVYGMIFSALFVAFIIYVPYVDTALQAAATNPLAFLPALGAGVFMLCYECLRKFLRKRGWFGGVPKKNTNLLELIRTTSTAA